MKENEFFEAESSPYPPVEQYPWEGPLGPMPDPDPPSEETISIKFARGLAGQPFTAKDESVLIRIKIPNPDPEDKRSWESFVVPAKSVHENKYGKGLWIRLPVSGETTLSRNVLKGTDQEGKNVWGNEYRKVSNTELKSMVEAYRKKSRGEER